MAARGPRIEDEGVRVDAREGHCSARRPHAAEVCLKAPQPLPIVLEAARDDAPVAVGRKRVAADVEGRRTSPLTNDSVVANLEPIRRCRALAGAAAEVLI